MSPVSRRRKPTTSVRRRRAAPGLGRHRAPALEVLTRELAKLRGVEDAFVVEGVAGYLLDVVDRRGPDDDRAFEVFSRECVDDPRAAGSVLGLQAMVVLAELGHHSARADAAALVSTATPDLAAALPGWTGSLGRVRLVEGAALRTADASESVLHLLLDYVDPGAGSRHLLTMAVEHPTRRVHLLDVRGREPDDVLAPMAVRYEGSLDPIWTWLDADALAPLVVDAVRETARHDAGEWPLLDVEGAASVCWTLGVRRLERLTGVLLPTGGGA